MSHFTPFDGRTSASVAGLDLENGDDGVTLSGTLEIPFDKAGLDRALALGSAVDAIIAALKSAPDLPERSQKAPLERKTAPNPM